MVLLLVLPAVALPLRGTIPRALLVRAEPRQATANWPAAAATFNEVPEGKLSPSGQSWMDGIVFSRTQPKLAAYTHILLFGEATPEDLIPATRETYDGPVIVGEDLMQFDIGDEVTVTENPLTPPPKKVAFFHKSCVFPKKLHFPQKK